MPIKVIKEVNNEFICKVMGIGKDAVPQGEEYYPVCGLCMNYMFDEALMLIDKGYKCTHKGYEAEEIFNIIGCSIGSIQYKVFYRR